MAGRGNRGGGGPGGGQQQSRGSEERENDTSRPASSVSEPDIHSDSDQEEALLSNPADCGTCKKKAMTDENKKMRSELEEWQAKCTAFKTEIVEETTDKVLDVVRDTVISQIQGIVKEEMNEKEEREKRQGNLILFNVVESQEEEAQIAKERDEEKCKEIIRSTQTNNVKIVEFKRLGKPNADNGRNKPRPILIEIESFEKKKEILKNARNLKFAKDWTREVGIMKDMTPRERTQHKELMKKLFEKRGNGELGYYVYDGKLLRNKAYAN
ncbi:hypothetical protein Pcinc_017302 [Petrolisthes cinctipes]|uniref:Uncharacterized protein n=1 Tax=Petrolisthes cinctipes TaxID=88211 RepID=A0AAE1FRS0_PETCI|nr:hypothetical protein Pcinc_017302 [Petrolisthes cinctipes]